MDRGKGLDYSFESIQHLTCFSPCFAGCTSSLLSALSLFLHFLLFRSFVTFCSFALSSLSALSLFRYFLLFRSFVTFCSFALSQIVAFSGCTSSLLSALSLFRHFLLLGRAFFRLVRSYFGFAPRVTDTETREPNLPGTESKTLNQERT